MTARENPHCGSSGVPFMKSTTGDASIAFWMCARASEDKSRRRTDEVTLGDPRVKVASWSEQMSGHRLLISETLSPTGNLEICLNMAAVRKVENGVLMAFGAVDVCPKWLTSSLKLSSRDWCSQSHDSVVVFDRARSDKAIYSPTDSKNIQHSAMSRTRSDQTEPEVSSWLSGMLHALSGG